MAQLPTDSRERTLNGKAGSSSARPKNYLSPLGEKIFLDRYAWKDGSKASLAAGDTVIVCVDEQTRQREIAIVKSLSASEGSATVTLRDGTVRDVAIEHIDKPIETTPGQTMARIARGIAAVEEASKQAEWEERFRWLLEDWKFVPGGRIWAGAGTDQNLTFYNCMPPDQEVLTDEGYKPIGEVQVGDRVVTHRNRLRRVLHRFERDTEEPLYTIRARKVGYDALRLTGEHKVLAIRSEWVNKHRSRDGLRLKHDPQWIPARDLKPGDFLAVAHDAVQREAPVLYLSDYVLDYEMADGSQFAAAYEVQDGILYKPQVRSSYHGHLHAGGTKYNLRDRLEVDEELCYLFGRWLGDGCITHRTKTDVPAGIKIVFNLEEKEVAEHLAEVINRRFGVPASVKLSSTSRWYDLWANSMPLGQFFKAFFGCYSYGKRIPAELLHLPDALTLELVRGLFQADGYTSTRGEVGILLANRTLATQLHQLLLRLGFFFSIFENTHRLAKHPSYRLSATYNECAPLFDHFFGMEGESPSRDQKYYFEHDSLCWVRITQIDQELYRGQVLDLEVDEDHSFVSAGLVVSNCYVVPSPHDSRGGIVETLQQMMEIMSRGGGVGINVSSLRPRYSYVKGVNGRSSGAVSWGGLYSFVTGLIEQGGSRRGALMLICNDWHPDVLEFIHSKREMGKITNANISVGISDAFMEAVRNDDTWELVFPDTSVPEYDEQWDGNLEAWQAAGHPVMTYKTVQAREMWHQIIESAWASAEPGLWFRERANRMSNSHYFNPLVCTNPCVAGDTLIYTAEGIVRTDELYRRSIASNVVVDGRFGQEETTMPASPVFLTGRKQVYRLTTREGYSLRATADHRVMTARGWVEMQALQPGDKVHILNRKGGFGKEGSLELGQVLGWLVGDGTIKQDKAVLSFFGPEKQELAPVFAERVYGLVSPLTASDRDYSVSVIDLPERNEARVASSRLRTLCAAHSLTPEEKHVVPQSVLQGSEAMQRGFLQALFTADGGFQDGGVKGGSIRLASSYAELLEDVQRLLLNFGIASRLYRNRRDASHREMPDGQGGSKAYWCRAQHELVITKRNMVRFAEEIGFLMAYKQEALLDYTTRGKRGPYTESFTARVQAVVPDGVEDVYDLTEPQTHSFTANGIVVHNCGEQPLPAWGICNLGAVNLARFVEDGAVDWEMLGQTVRYAVRFLDDVIDATPYFFDENADQQGKERRVGLGVMGLAEMLIRLGLRYGSPEGNEFVDRLFKFFATEAYHASADYAAEKGSFPAFDAEKFLESGFMQQMPEEVREAVREKGVRNVTLMTVAPTGTTGTMVGTSTGIEPYYFWTYFRKSRLGTHEEVVDVVAEWQEANSGAELPDYFVTAMDLKPEEHVRVQAAVQRWIDSSISKTANVPNEYTVEQLAELYELMYDLGCKGGTVYRDGSRDEQVLSVKKDKEPAKPPVERAELSPNYTSRGEHKQARPRRLAGATYFIQTPIGKAYVTVNRDSHTEQPFEVFANVGKVGSEGAAMSEALGRLISLVLRLPSNISQNERLDMVISELDGIGGARSIGFGPNRVASLPDALARVLREDLEAGRELEVSYLLGETDPLPQQLDLLATTMKADLCPECGHASFVRVEGCQKCYSCGHSEC